VKLALPDKLDSLTEDEALKLESIPGLHVYPSHAIGRFDAVAAGYFRLTGEKLKLKDAFILPSIKAKLEKLKDPRPYQRRGINWLYKRLSLFGWALLADDMGLGKTFQALTTLRYLLNSEDRMLVVAPRAASETWRDELKKWGFHDSVVVSPTRPKSYVEAASARVVVTSYDHRVLDKTIDSAFEDVWPQALILDEIHRVKGRKSLRSKKLKDIGPLATYRLGLSATPQYDRPRDLFQQLEILSGKAFGNKYAFDIAYCAAKEGKHGGLDNKGQSNPDELKLRMSYYLLRREKVDVADELPSLTRQVRWVDATNEAKRDLAKAQMGFGKGSLHTALMSTLKGKMEEAMLLASEAKRFLLFTWTKQHVHQMTRLLNTEYETPCVAITGELSVEKRAKEIRLAKSKGWGIVATLESASESLNLQGVASTGIMHAISWQALRMWQGEGRLHRLGQLDPVLWYYLAMHDSADMVVLPTVLNKLDQWGATMGRRGSRGLRHALGEAIEGPEAVKAEEEVLKQIYKEMTT